MEQGNRKESIPLRESVIYGPVGSRRLGSSLGINLSPRSVKSCSFDCAYCQYGHTRDKMNVYDEEDVPGTEEVYSSLRENLEVLEEDPSYITFSGNGEPTLHPDFPEIVDGVKRVRDRHSDARIAVLTNASRIGDGEVQDALNRTDLPILKLDVGSQEKLKEINRTPDTDYREMVEGMKDVKGPYLQSLKFRGEAGNMDEDINDWLDVVEELQPEEVQIYTLDRPTWKNLSRAGEEELREIARILENRGITAEVYY